MRSQLSATWKRAFPSTQLCWQPDLQNCEKSIYAVDKLPSLWYFVLAACPSA